MILYPANSEDDFVILNGIGYARAHHYDHVQIMETCDFASIPADEPVAIIGHGEPPEVIEGGTVLEPTLAEKMPWEVGSMLDSGKYQKKAPILLISCSAGVSSKQESKDSFVHLLAAEFPGVAVTGKRGIALFGEAIPDTVIAPSKARNLPQRKLPSETHWVSTVRHLKSIGEIRFRSKPELKIGPISSTTIRN